jgi:hypothetical protein
MYRKTFLYLKSAFDQQMGQNWSLRHKPRLQSHVVLTHFVIVPGLCGKDRFTYPIAGFWSKFWRAAARPKDNYFNF